MKQTILLSILLITSVIANAQLFKPKSGKYTEEGTSSRGFPYTTFDNSLNAKSIPDQLTDIRTKINGHTDNYEKIYAKIYDNAIGSITSGCGDGNVCAYASRAKDAAFVYLVGIGMNGTSFYTLDGSSTPKTRAFFYDQAVGILKFWSTKAEGGLGGKENQVYRAKENIMILQAYDFLEASVIHSGGSFNSTDRDMVRYQMFLATYELYSRANNLLSFTINDHLDIGGALTIDNNMALTVSAAVGLGSVILHDRAVYFWQIQAKPSRWASAAHSYINEVMWEDDAPMGERDKKQSAGYAEGPHYYRFAYEALWPFFQSFKNFTGGTHNRRYGPYRKRIWYTVSNYINNYYQDSDYLKLNDWYLAIQLPNGCAPTFDDSWIDGTFAGTFISGSPEHSIIPNPTDKLLGSVNMAADYLAKFNISSNTQPEYPQVYANRDAGNLIVRFNSDTGLANRHYIHVNAERGSALNGGVNNHIGNSISWGHEHGDVTSISLFSGISDYLALDPALFGTQGGNNRKINKGEHHNVITIDEEGPHEEDNAVWSDLQDFGNLSIISVNANYWNRLLGVKTDRKSIISRQVVVHKDKHYYTVFDKATNRDFIGSQDVAFHFSGNGTNTESQVSFHQQGNIAIWDHPCVKETSASTNNIDNWKIRVTSTAIVDDAVLNLNYIPSFDNHHGNSTEINYWNFTADAALATNMGQIAKDIPAGAHNGEEGTHASVSLKHTIGFNEEIRYITTIELLKCSDTTMFSKSPFITQTGVYTSHLLEKDSILDLHLAKSYLKTEIDTATDPLKIDPTAILSTDGQNLFFSYSLNPEFRSGNCVSYSNFRKARLVNGRLFEYHDTVYIENTKVSTVFYSLVGKCKYKAVVETDTAGTVKFYLPDVELGTGIQMKVNGYSYTYNDITGIMSVQVPIGQSIFDIELADPCRVSCFFPSTAETIHNTFDFSSGLSETLGHKLNIVRPNGFLNITNGSSMILCDGIYLRNMDSLVLWSGCSKDTGQMNINVCEGNSKGGAAYGAITGWGGGNARPSTITVKADAALILEDSSFTQISNNSVLQVWGSLIIKNGARLLIGDGRPCSYATIMVYPGAYVHIEDDAWLEFYKVVQDTIDRHIFYISAMPAGAQSGISPNIINLLNTDTVITSSNTAMAICDLKYVTPTYGIANREWGFCNVLDPKAIVKLPNDTICLGECLTIDFKASLNDPIRELEVCRIDTIFGMAILNCFGSKQIIGGGLENGYNEGTTCYSTEPHLSFFNLCDYINTPGHWYKIKVTAKNHCNSSDSVNLYFYIDEKPDAVYSFNDPICQGYGTVTAYNSSLISTMNAVWHVHMLDSGKYQDNDVNPSYYGGDWELNKLDSGDAFTFPGFRWYGGYKYAICLTQKNYCGETSEWDTIEIQPGARITASPAAVYSDPLGPSSLQLHGFVGDASSFAWNPTTYLDDPYSLNPIATPTDTITYVLNATNGGCTAYDTLFIQHNNLAFAGRDSLVCSNSEVITGPNYDASLLLSILSYMGGGTFHTVYDPWYTMDTMFYENLSLFMLTVNGRPYINAGGCSQFMNFYSTFDRGQFYRQSWFPEFYRLYISQTSHADAFDFFSDSVHANYSLDSYLSSNNLWIDQNCFSDLLNGYNAYRTDPMPKVGSTWDVYTNGSWTSLTSWNDFSKTIQTITSTSTFKLTVIDNRNSTVEYDQVTYTTDTTITPIFDEVFQIDSTVYFANISDPVTSTAHYTWDFGDGTTSTEISPMHTFPAFDSNYVVCLNVTNVCGTFSRCDTVRVDSAGLLVNFYTRKPSGNPISLSQKIQDNYVAMSKEKDFQCLVYPNPFDNKAVFVYKIDAPFEGGHIEVFNTLGQSMGQYILSSSKGSVSLDTENYPNGLYFYNFVVANAIIKTGKILKE